MGNISSSLKSAAISGEIVARSSNHIIGKNTVGRSLYILKRNTQKGMDVKFVSLLRQRKQRTGLITDIEKYIVLGDYTKARVGNLPVDPEYVTSVVREVEFF